MDKIQHLNTVLGYFVRPSVAYIGQKIGEMTQNTVVYPALANSHLQGRILLPEHDDDQWPAAPRLPAVSESFVFHEPSLLVRLPTGPTLLL